MDTTPAADKKGNNCWPGLLFTMFLIVNLNKRGPLFLASPQQSLTWMFCVQMPRRRRMPQRQKNQRSCRTVTAQRRGPHLESARRKRRRRPASCSTLLMGASQVSSSFLSTVPCVLCTCVCLCLSICPFLSLGLAFLFSVKTCITGVLLCVECRSICIS